jgi:hypothetical protein
MAKTTAARRSGPVSVVLPAALQQRIDTQGKRRGLKLSTALRALVTERLEQLEDEERQTASEVWQRQQAWSTWEKVKKGPPEEATSAALAGVFSAARRRRGQRR